jgi:SAM-dependent methyltransferase
LTGPPSTAGPPPLEELIAADQSKACCAAVYAHPAVRWLLGDELHPGGEATTRRALELVRLGPGERLLDVASGTGSSALLAAREFGCRVVGIDYGPNAVRGASQAADAAGLSDRVAFSVGDAEELAFGDEEFDVLLCECSLCVFPDKSRAVAEMRRVLRPRGRLALSDVTVDRRRLPSELLGPLGAVACVGEALSTRSYSDLLASGGLRVVTIERRDGAATVLAERLRDRLRGARVLGLDRIEGSSLSIEEAIELVGVARRAIADGALGYAIFAAVR